MLLKKITIFGFKSFVEKTTIEISPQMTAVIGPNGCGKSNVIDAVRWVLGEQSAKTLRGSRMEDVIFSGSEKRKPLNFAEVSIYFEDTYRQLGYDYKEIQVTRRLYRSGDSEYYINKTSCRLKDIHELFMDTGAGKEVYSIVGQNRVEEIISAKPEERRELLEEAAGILKYKTRKKDARKRLEEMKSNVQRVNDLIYELENQLEPLEEQAEVALRYRELKDALKEKEKLIMSHRIGANREAIEKIELRYSHVQNEKLQAASQLSNKDREMEELKNKGQDIQLEKRKLEEKLNNFQHEKEQIESRLNLVEEKVQNLHRQQEEYERQLAELNSRREKIVANQESWRKQLQEKEELQFEIASEIERLHKKTETLQNDDSLLSMESLQEELTSAISRQEVLESTMEELQERETELEQKINHQKNQAWKQEEKIDNMQRKIDGLKEQQEEKNKALQKMDKEKQETANSLEKWQAYKDGLEEKLTEVKEELSTYENRLWLLQKMDNDVTPVQKGAEALLAGETKFDGVIGSFAALVKAPAEIKPALEVALGDKVFGVVAENEDVALQAAESLQQNRQGWANVIPVNLLQEAKSRKIPDWGELIQDEPGIRGRAVDLVEVEASYRDALHSLLEDIVITEDLPSALKIARKSDFSVYAATIRGEVVYPGGIIRGGDDGSEESGRWDIKEEMKQLEEKKETYQAEKEEWEKKLQECADKVKELQENEKNLHKQREKRHKELNNLNQEISLQGKEIEHLQENLENINQSIEALIAEKNEARQKSDDVFNELEEAKSGRSDLESQLSKMREKYRHLLEEKDETSNLLKEKQIEQNKIVEQKNNLDEKLDQSDREIKDIQTKIDSLHADERQRKGKLQELNQSKEEYKTRQDELAHNSKEVNEEFENINKKFTDNQAAITELEKHMQQFRAQRNKAEKREHKLELEKTRLQTEEEHQLHAFQEKFGEQVIPMQELPDFNESEIESEIEVIRKDIADLGEVRLGAIEERERINERLKFLRAQQDDLQDGENYLQEVLAEIDERIKKQFQEALSDVGEYFQETFSELFGGGNAVIQMTDEKNVLESGIELIVQPPGKNLKNMNLLSGGEKTLTAIALLFAIFKYKPAPFYFLDEIESALDDNNLVKFNDFLDKATGRSQFILVTHRRRSMENANFVYGVTMAEAGVSRLVSVKLDQKAS